MADPKPMMNDDGTVTGVPQDQPDPTLQYIRSYVNKIPAPEGLSMLGMVKSSATGLLNLIQGWPTGEITAKDVVDSGVAGAAGQMGVGIMRGGVKGVFKASQEGLGTYFTHITSQHPEAGKLAPMFRELQNKAYGLEREGASVKEILKETGLQRDNLRNWVAEISDEKLAFSSRAQASIHAAMDDLNVGYLDPVSVDTNMKLKDFLSVPQGTPKAENIFEWSPRLGELDVRLIGPHPENTSARAGGRAILAKGQDLSRGRIEVEVPNVIGSSRRTGALANMRATLFHEIQHQIASDVNSEFGLVLMSPGTNPETAGAMIKKAVQYRDYLKQFGRIEDPHLQTLQKINNFLLDHPDLPDNTARWVVYAREAGEIGAETVGQSSNLPLRLLREVPLAEREVSFGKTTGGAAVDTSREGSLNFYGQRQAWPPRIENPPASGGTQGVDILADLAVP